MIYIYISMVFIFGLLFGSFANVVILRFPKGISIVKPRSFCPHCMAAIPWYLNIPVLSYIFLGGKCINCKSPISFRYPLVELLTAVITLSWFLKFGMTITALIYFFCGLLLIIASGIDYDYKVLPPQFTYSLILIGLAASPFNEFLTGSIFESLAGAVAGAALIY
jgi:leader peptidase (prepilin peptidase)/N-methyltransferase